MGEAYLALHTLRCRSRATQHRLAEGQKLGPDTSIDKVLLANAEQRLYDTVRDLLLYNMSLAARSMTAEQVAELDAVVAAWNIGDLSPVNDAPVFTGEDILLPPVADGAPVTGSLAVATDR